jgi:hypothetical protein
VIVVRKDPVCAGKYPYKFENNKKIKKEGLALILKDSLVESI